MNIYLIRHTTPKIKKGYAYGQSDLDVVETFKAEAQEIKNILPKKLLHSPFYSSPLQRCQKLANYLSEKEPMFRKEILELDFGDWEMQPWSEITNDYWEKWQKDFTEVPTPNGESYRDLYHRSVDFWQGIKFQKEEMIAVVTHFGVIQALLSYLLYIPLEKSFKININYGAVIRVELEEKRERIHFLK